MPMPSEKLSRPSGPMSVMGARNKLRLCRTPRASAMTRLAKIKTLVDEALERSDGIFMFDNIDRWLCQAGGRGRVTPVGLSVDRSLYYYPRTDVYQ